MGVFNIPRKTPAMPASVPVWHPVYSQRTAGTQRHSPLKQRIHEIIPPRTLPLPLPSLSPLFLLPTSTSSSSPRLDNSLQLARVPERVLNNTPADLLLQGGGVAARLSGVGGVGEVDVAVADGPAALAGEVDDGALGVEE